MFSLSLLLCPFFLVFVWIVMSYLLIMAKIFSFFVLSLHQHFHPRTMVMSKTSISIIHFLLLALLMSSCGNYKTFYQMTRVSPVQTMSTEPSALVYDDSLVTIRYNFWAEAGSMVVMVTNKSDKSISLDLSECFFVKNGVVYNYYTDVSYSGFADGLSTAADRSSLFAPSVSYSPSSSSVAEEADKNSMFKKKSGYDSGMTPIVTRPDRLVMIPAGLSRVMNAFSVQIQPDLFHDCSLFLYPSSAQQKSVRIGFDRQNTPLTFGNRLTVVADGRKHLISNDFFVTEIANFAKSDFVQSVKQKKSFCPDEVVPNIGKDKTSSYVKTDSFRLMSPDAFYRSYKKLPTDAFLH